MTRHIKWQEIQFGETEQASEPVMTEMLGWKQLSRWDGNVKGVWEFKTTMINMPRALMDRVDSMQEQMAL